VRSLVTHVDVDRPVQHVYDQWSLLEELPRIMPSVQSVRQLDERTTHWVVKISGEQREFAATTTEQVPDMRVAWRSHGRPPHSGVVTFHRLDEARTRLTLQLDWEPVGLFDKLGDRSGTVRRALDRDLAVFKAHVEAHPAPATGWRGTIAAGAGPTAKGEAADAGKAAAGPGRHAAAPTEIPSAGWLQVVKRTMKELKHDHATVIAGGVAFYVFLALIPALAAVVSVYGLVADPQDVTRQVESFTDAMPDDAASLVEEQLTTITEQEPAGLGIAAVTGIAAALWAASRGFKALIDALNAVYDEEETRKGWRVKALAVGFTVVQALAAVGLVAGIVVLGAIADRLPTGGGVALGIARWIGLFAFLVLGLAFVYRFAPDRDDPKWRWTTPGALAASALLVVASVLFSVYVNSFGSYSETYGSLGAVVVLLLWLQVAAFVILFGAELDSELERQTAVDTTVGRREPMGRRGAYAADSVASS
jgi:membrane protein